MNILYFFQQIIVMKGHLLVLFNQTTVIGRNQACAVETKIHHIETYVVFANTCCFLTVTVKVMCPTCFPFKRVSLPGKYTKQLLVVQ